MARLGGLFHVFRTIPKAFKRKRRFDNELHKFHRRLPGLAKNSTAQNWHKAAQNLVTRTRSVRTEKRAPRQPPGQVIFDGYFLGLSQAIPRAQSCRGGSGFRFHHSEVRSLPPQPIIIAGKQRISLRIAKHSQRFHVASCRKNSRLFSRPPNLCRRLQATWTQHEMGKFLTIRFAMICLASCATSTSV